MQILLEFAKIRISKDSPKNRGEVAQHGKEVVPYCRIVFIEQKDISQIERENG